MSVWEFGYKGKDGFRRNKYGDASVIKKWVLEYGPLDIYTSVFKYESEDISASKLEAGLYFDIDNGDNLDAAYEDLLALIAILKSQGIERESFNVWFSGFKGFHLTIPFNAMGIEPAKDLPQVYKKIALELNQLLPNKNIDFTVYESKRLWRFPNTINSKSGLYKIQVANDIQTLEKIKELAKTSQDISLFKTIPNKILALWVDRARREIEEASRPKPVAQRFHSAGIGYDATKVLAEGKASPGRNQSCFWLACYLKSKGYSLPEVTTQLLEWGERCIPSASANISDFNPKAIELTVKSAFKGGART